MINQKHNSKLKFEVYEVYYDITIFKYMYICVRDTPSLTIVTSKHT